jgi:hypothetical protein
MTEAELRGAMLLILDTPGASAHEIVLAMRFLLRADRLESAAPLFEETLALAAQVAAQVTSDDSVRLIQKVKDKVLICQPPSECRCPPAAYYCRGDCHTGKP